MHLRRTVHFGMLLGLQWLVFSACGGTTIAPPNASGQSVLGRWARSAPECRRPELIFEKASATLHSEADGQALAFLYEAVRYAEDGPNLVKVEFGKLHPYGTTASRTALTFKVVSSDSIELMQGKKPVAFKRCSSPTR